MRVTRFRIESLIVKIARTREREASCDDCARLSAELVEALLNGTADAKRFDEILQHLEECIPCSEEFKVLRDCAQMDKDDSWPSTQEMWRRLLEPIRDPEDP